MEPVDLVARQLVDVPLHEVGAEEVATHVQVHAPIGKAGRVGHVESRQPDGRAAVQTGREVLGQRLEAVEDAGVVGACHHHRIAGDAEVVPLRVAAPGHPGADGALRACAGLHGQGPPGGGAHGRGPGLGDPSELGVPGVGHRDGRVGADLERPLARGDLDGAGEEDGSRRGPRARGGGDGEARDGEAVESGHGWIRFGGCGAWRTSLGVAVQASAGAPEGPGVKKVDPGGV